jgi:sigma-E factor negative regulatory protein RseC
MTSCASPLLETAGIVKEIKGKALFVEITVNEACQGCRANKSCVIGSVPNTRIIEIAKHDNAKFQVGDHVTIIMQMKTGIKAVVIAYVVPFLLFFVSMLTATCYELSELKVGIYSIGTIAIYYLCLYFLRSRIKKAVTFSIKD